MFVFVVATIVHQNVFGRWRCGARGARQALRVVQHCQGIGWPDDWISSDVQAAGVDLCLDRRDVCVYAFKNCRRLGAWVDELMRVSVVLQNIYD